MIPFNLQLGADGYYALPVFDGAPVVHVSPDGDDAAPGTPQQPVKTIGRARKMIVPGKPGTVLLLAGARFLDQAPWIDGGGALGGPHVYATYGGTDRAIIDNSNPAVSETAAQIRGPTLLSDLEFACEPGKSGVRPHGKFQVFAQNVLVHGAGLGWDMNACELHWHRCVTRDCWAPTGRSQGAYITMNGRLSATGKVFDTCGWKLGTPVSVAEAGRNHCLYVDEQSVNPSDLEDVWVSRGCSHGLQMRTGGRLQHWVAYGNPIAGFSQGHLAQVADGYVENDGHNQLGQGQQPTAEPRGWGWDLQTGDGTIERVAFNRGGNTHPVYSKSSRALSLGAMVGDALERAPGYVPHGVRLHARGIRIASWVGGMRNSAPADEIGDLDVQVDAPDLRWPSFSARDYLEQVRGLDRGGDWGIIRRVQQAGYQTLEPMVSRARLAEIATLQEALAKTLRSL